ncbi:trichohyalin [Aplysia californica]|uniref:Trichohyalin n=1 Tax=Aplysia californica TaxID=6500 RepID=A0ABM0ZWJ7_APLCA|nr:trichohyalin [Aplysia californica]
MDQLKVAIRVRPLLQNEIDKGLTSRWITSEATIRPEGSSGPEYAFDHVYNEKVSNLKIYKEMTHNMVQRAMEGFHGTLFTYGQSGSGKTFTIDSLRSEALKNIYEYIENCPAREFLVRCSYIELYNEKLVDLLADEQADNKELKIREDPDKNVYIDNLVEDVIVTLDDSERVLNKGNEKRTFAETRQNDRSSRAHCIFRVVIESRERDDPNRSGVFVSHLNLVDLAGSERAGENIGDRRREGCSINTSLLWLSQVIKQLSLGQSNQLINFRNSKLTRLLQNALGGNSQTGVLCTVNPTAVEETHSTLKFAENAKKVINKPQQNEVLTDRAMLKKKQDEINKLKKTIRQMEQDFRREDVEELQQQRLKQDEQIKRLQSLLCVSSKVTGNRRSGPEQKRRETVCIPQMSRFQNEFKGDFTLPRIPVFPPPLPDTPINSKPPVKTPSPSLGSLTDLSVPHSLESACELHDCPCQELSFSDFEKQFVDQRILDSYHDKVRKLKQQNLALTKKLREFVANKFVTRRGETTELADVSLDPNFSSPFRELDNSILIPSAASTSLINPRQGGLLSQTIMEEEEEEEITLQRSFGGLVDEYERRMKEKNGELEILKEQLEDVLASVKEEERKNEKYRQSEAAEYKERQRETKEIFREEYERMVKEKDGEMAILKEQLEEVLASVKGEDRNNEKDEQSQAQIHKEALRETEERLREEYEMRLIEKEREMVTLKEQLEDVLTSVKREDREKEQDKQTETEKYKDAEERQSEREEKLKEEYEIRLQEKDGEMEKLRTQIEVMLVKEKKPDRPTESDEYSERQREAKERFWEEYKGMVTEKDREVAMLKEQLEDLLGSVKEEERKNEKYRQSEAAEYKESQRETKEIFREEYERMVKEKDGEMAILKEQLEEVLASVKGEDRNNEKDEQSQAQIHKEVLRETEERLREEYEMRLIEKEREMVTLKEQLEVVLASVKREDREEQDKQTETEKYKDAEERQSERDEKLKEEYEIRLQEKDGEMEKLRTQIEVMLVTEKKPDRLTESDEYPERQREAEERFWEEYKGMVTEKDREVAMLKEQLEDVLASLKGEDRKNEKDGQCGAKKFKEIQRGIEDEYEARLMEKDKEVETLKEKLEDVLAYVKEVDRKNEKDGQSETEVEESQREREEKLKEEYEIRLQEKDGEMEMLRTQIEVMLLNDGQGGMERYEIQGETEERIVEEYETRLMEKNREIVTLSQQLEDVLSSVKEEDRKNKKDRQSEAEERQSEREERLKEECEIMLWEKDEKDGEMEKLRKQIEVMLAQDKERDGQSEGEKYKETQRETEERLRDEYEARLLEKDREMAALKEQFDNVLASVKGEDRKNEMDGQSDAKERQTEREEKLKEKYEIRLQEKDGEMEKLRKQIEVMLAEEQDGQSEGEKYSERQRETEERFKEEYEMMVMEKDREMAMLKEQYEDVLASMKEEYRKNTNDGQNETDKEAKERLNEREEKLKEEYEIMLQENDREMEKLRNQIEVMLAMEKEWDGQSEEEKYKHILRKTEEEYKMRLMWKDREMVTLKEQLEDVLASVKGEDRKNENDGQNETDKEAEERRSEREKLKEECEIRLQDNDREMEKLRRQIEVTLAQDKERDGECKGKKCMERLRETEERFRVEYEMRLKEKDRELEILKDKFEAKLISEERKREEDGQKVHEYGEEEQEEKLRAESERALKAKEEEITSLKEQLDRALSGIWEERQMEEDRREMMEEEYKEIGKKQRESFEELLDMKDGDLKSLREQLTMAIARRDEERKIGEQEREMLATELERNGEKLKAEFKEMLMVKDSEIDSLKEQLATALSSQKQDREMRGKGKEIMKNQPCQATAPGQNTSTQTETSLSEYEIDMYRLKLQLQREMCNRDVAKDNEQAALMEKKAIEDAHSALLAEKRQMEEELKSARATVKASSSQAERLAAEMEKLHEKHFDDMSASDLKVMRLKEQLKEARAEANVLDSSYLQQCPRPTEVSAIDRHREQLRLEFENSGKMLELRELQVKVPKLEEQVAALTIKLHLLSTEKVKLEHLLKNADDATTSAQSLLSAESAVNFTLRNTISGLEWKLNVPDDAEPEPEVLRLEGETRRLRREVALRDKERDELKKQMHHLGTRYRLFVEKYREREDTWCSQEHRVVELESKLEEASKKTEVDPEQEQASVSSEGQRARSVSLTERQVSVSPTRQRAAQRAHGGGNGRDCRSRSSSPAMETAGRKDSDHIKMEPETSHQLSGTRPGSATESVIYKTTEVQTEPMRSGGFSEYFVIISKDRQIKELKKSVANLETQLKQHGVPLPKKRNTASVVPLTRSAKENKEEN